MDWYKHKTGSHDDPDISDAWDEFGDAGYVVFFVLLEIYGQEFSHLNDEKLTISKAFLRRKLRKSWTKVEQILRFYQEKKRIFYSVTGKQVSIEIPKYIELSSNWTRWGKKSPTQAPTQAPTKNQSIEEEEEEEEEKKKKKKERDPRVKLFIDWWCEMFEYKKKQPYPIPDGGKLGGQVKNLLKCRLSFEDIQFAAMGYLMDKDPYITEKMGHDLGGLIIKIVKYSQWFDDGEKEENRKYLIPKDKYEGKQ